MFGCVFGIFVDLLPSIEALTKEDLAGNLKFQRTLENFAKIIFFRKFSNFPKVLKTYGNDLRTIIFISGGCVFFVDLLPSIGALATGDLVGKSEFSFEIGNF